MIRNLFIIIYLLTFISCQSRVSENTQAVQGLVEQIDVVDSVESSTLDNFQNLVEDFENPTRNEWQHPELILQSLGPLENQVIADIGAGTGYFTFKIAQKGAKVLAIDIEQQFLDYIEDRKVQLDDIIAYDMVQTILSVKDDPLLPEKGVDGALLVNTYHFIEGRVNYMQKVRKGLKEEGKLVIVDYKKGHFPIGPEESFKVSAEVVINELRQAGFTMVELDHKSLEYQYLITAKK